MKRLIVTGMPVTGSDFVGRKEELTMAQLETLFNITSSENLYSNHTKINVARSVKSLLHKGIIKRRARGRYGIIDPFFEEFLLRNQ